MSILKPTDLPEWGTGAGNNIDPGALKKVEGWLFGELAVSGWQNWHMNLVYEWVDFIDRIVDSTVANEILIGNGNQVHITLKDDDVRLGIDAEEYVRFEPGKGVLMDGTNDVLEFTPGQALVSDNAVLKAMGESFGIDVLVNTVSQGTLVPDGDYDFVVALYKGPTEIECHKISETKSITLLNQPVAVWFDIPEKSDYYRLFMRVDGGSWISTSSNALSPVSIYGKTSKIKLSIRHTGTYEYIETIDFLNANTIRDLDTTQDPPVEAREPLVLQSNGELSNEVDKAIRFKRITTGGQEEPITNEQILSASVVAFPNLPGFNFPNTGLFENDGVTLGSCKVRLESVYPTSDASRFLGSPGFGVAYESGVLTLTATNQALKFTIPSLPAGASCWQITASHTGSGGTVDDLALVGYIHKKYVMHGTDESMYLRINTDALHAVLNDYIQIGPDDSIPIQEWYIEQIYNDSWYSPGIVPRRSSSYNYSSNVNIENSVESSVVSASYSDVPRDFDGMITRNDPSKLYKHNTAFAWAHFTLNLQPTPTTGLSNEIQVKILSSHNIKGMAYIEDIAGVNETPQILINFEHQPLGGPHGHVSEYIGIDRSIGGVFNFYGESPISQQPQYNISVGNYATSGFASAPHGITAYRLNDTAGTWANALPEAGTGTVVFFAK